MKKARPGLRRLFSNRASDETLLSLSSSPIHLLAFCTVNLTAGCGVLCQQTVPAAAALVTTNSLQWDSYGVVDSYSALGASLLHIAVGDSGPRACLEARPPGRAPGVPAGSNHGAVASPSSGKLGAPVCF